jgi:hypothetical protein
MNARPRILALFGSGLLLGQERGNIEALAALRDEGCEVLCVIRDEPGPSSCRRRWMHAACDG